MNYTCHIAIKAFGSYGDAAGELVLYQDGGKMTKKNHTKIQIKEYLSEHDLIEVQELEKQCIAYDTTSLKLELDYKFMVGQENKNAYIENMNEFFYYIDQVLVGYMGICSFGGSDLEVNGMVHPDHRRKGIFTQLFTMVKNEWFMRKINQDNLKMLILSDANSKSGEHFVDSVKANFNLAEYEMVHNNTKEIGKREAPKSKDDTIYLRKASNADALEIARQNEIYFGDVHKNEVDNEDKDTSEPTILIYPEEEEKRGMTIYMAELGSTIIGKVHIEMNKNRGGIFGLGILPEFRRKGYGREILTQAVSLMQNNGCKEVFLQVVTENEKALDLYLDCGFVKQSTMNYYNYEK